MNKKLVTFALVVLILGIVLGRWSTDATNKKASMAKEEKNRFIGLIPWSPPFTTQDLENHAWEWN